MSLDAPAPVLPYTHEECPPCILILALSTSFNLLRKCSRLAALEAGKRFQLESAVKWITNRLEDCATLEVFAGEYLLQNSDCKLA